MADRCRSHTCQAPLLWIITTNTGSRMPLDAEPNPDGNVDVLPAVPGQPRMGTVHSQPPLMVEGELHMPHHATCPDAESYRWT